MTTHGEQPEAVPSTTPVLPPVVLRLYVAGSAPRSAWAIRNVRALCERHLAGRYELEIIDIYQQPELCAPAQLLAVPTLVKHLPPPLQRFIGTMTNTDGILGSLGCTLDPPRRGDP
jgi:circadian clock protein KaiB